MQYEQTFNSIDNILRNEAGCSTELDYIEQTSWLLFLKYLDDLDREREMKAKLTGKDFKPIITGYMRWSQWAAPKTADGKIDDVNAMTGPDLTNFVDEKLFPYLREFQKTASSAKNLEYKIGEIFAELRNKITSGYNLREIINQIDQLHFQSAEDKHEMTVLYESKIAKMGNAGRNGGEYYTPRPLIRTIVKVVDPKIGETVYDPACGSAGFLCEAFSYMKEHVDGTKDNKILQEDTFFGKEKKPLPYIIATMNMIFHGVAAPNIIRGNTLAENLSQIQEHDRKNVILANPPFGGSERGEVKQNFDINTSETAYMFMQHFIAMLKAGGRAGIVIKNTFLSNGDAAALRKLLMEQCNLHTILDLPQGVFQGAGVKTVVLFFDKGTPTKKIWYYQLNPGRNLGKTNALNEEDLAEFVELQKTKADSENSWTVDVSTLGEDCDLSVKNPNKVEERDERTAAEIAASLLIQLDKAHKQFMVECEVNLSPKEGWKIKKLGEACYTLNGLWKGKKQPFVNIGVIRNANFTKDFTLRYDNIEYLDVEERQYSKRKLYKGDLIVEKSGGSDKQPVGRAVLFDKDEGEFSFSNFTSVLRIKDKTELLSEYLYKYLLFVYLRGDTKKMQKATTGIHNIEFEKYLNIDIPYPPLSEQKRIVKYIDDAFCKISTLKRNLDKALAECDALKQAILRQVFE